MSVTIENGWLHGSLPDDTGRQWPVRRFPQENPSNPGLRHIGTPNLVLHTTETDGYVESLRVPSEFQCGEGVIGQHIRLGFAGDALFSWDQRAMGIEMVGHSKLGLWLEDEPTLGPTVALTAWLHSTERIRTGLKRPDGQDWPLVLDRPPQASEAYYRRHAGLWPNTPGVYGHVDIPDNAHWDPGSWNYPRFFERVQGALTGDDMGFQEFKAGVQAANRGEPFPGDADPDFAFGYRMETRGTSEPTPTIPGAHEHADDDWFKKHQHIGGGVR